MSVSNRGTHNVLERLKRIAQTLDPERNSEQLAELNDAIAALEHELKVGDHRSIARAAFHVATLAKFLYDHWPGG